MHTGPIDWSWTDFAALGGRDLHDIFQLRAAVFVVEQDCAYQDLDGRDPEAWHLCGRVGGELVAYLRAFPPGVDAEEAVIGRVIVRADHRGSGLGAALMARGLAELARAEDAGPVRISAQAHLERFYQRLGFETVGPSYLEDGIPHLPMVRAGARPDAP